MAMTCCLPTRFLIVLMCTTAGCVTFLNRSNLNVTIIAMTEPIKQVSNNKSNDICPFPHFSNETLNRNICESNLKFNWTQSEQGQILGSFFYSYILLMIPMGAMAKRYGGKYIIIASLFLSGIVNIATPFIAEKYWLMVSSRIALGVIQSGFFPSIFSIICLWIPARDRSISFGILSTGGYLGSVITTFLSGWLSDQNGGCGWPMVFYISGICSIIFCIIFSFFVTSNPKHNKMISKSELKMIQNDLGMEKNIDSEIIIIPTPWIAIITNKCVIAIFAAKFASEWLSFTLSTKLPAYLSDFIHVELTENGALNSAMYVTAMISSISIGYISERVVEQEWTSRTNVRKIFSSLAATGIAVSMSLVPTAGCSESILMVLVLTSYFFMEFSAGGDSPMPAEISRNHPSIVYSIINSMTMSTGFIAPAVIGYILDTFKSKGWNIVFYLSPIVSMIGIIIFLCWASAERQDFDYIGSNEQKVSKCKNNILHTGKNDPILLQYNHFYLKEEKY